MIVREVQRSYRERFDFLVKREKEKRKKWELLRARKCGTTTHSRS